MCDDANPCTTDTCNPATGTCVYTPNTNPCDDGNVCTTNDACGLGAAIPVGSENFDGVVAPALPAGWSTTTTAGNPWVTSVTTPDTAPNSAFTDDPAVVTDKKLISPVYAIATPSARLTFRNRYTFEASTLPNTWDGGVLEIKIGAGAFTDIVTAGGSFVSGGYTAVVNSGFSNPLAGRAAWGNNNGSVYTTVVVNLPATAAGQNVQFQWRVGTDTSGAGTGQNVDSISIVDRPSACVGGTPLNCDDGNACTLDSCDPLVPGGCVHTAGATCDDSNPCTDDTCDTGTGQCVFTPQ